MRHLSLLLCAILISVFCSVDGQSQNKEIDLEAFFTDTRITGNDHSDPEACSETVFNSRKLANQGESPVYINGSTKSWLVGVQPTVSLRNALIIFVGVGLLAILVATLFQRVRKHVYHDADNLDTAFDAGGKVSIGLTATTIVSQWTWTATLLQSTTVASKFGISGPYWYAGGATIQIILFAVLSIMLKTKAPGAKTFLQVIKARFGRNTHIVYCCFAIFTNVVVMLMLMLAGTAVLTSLVQGLSSELAAMLLAAIIGGYTLIGGLGATFYVSYFNTGFIFILILLLIVEVFYNPFDNELNPFGNSASVFDYISCWKAPEGNSHNSYITFFSAGGFTFGVINIVGNFGSVFCDQSYWQSSVAAKPLQGVWGFITGGLTWFAIPFSLATTMGLAYIGLSSAQGYPLLTDEDISKGLAAPLVAQRLLGSTGEYVIIFLILMAIMSTGSAEVIAVASIIIYDIYQAYIEPFRRDLIDDSYCILCGNQMKEIAAVVRENGFSATSLNICQCKSSKNCEDCLNDNIARSKKKGLVRPHLTCKMHKDYREYQESLVAYKNWSIVIFTILSIPLVLFGLAVNLNLAWTYYFMGVLISSCVFPVAFTITWPRVSSQGMMAGVIGGCISGIVCWLSYTHVYEGGLSSENFIENTGKDMPMLIGNLVSIFSGGLIVIVVSLITRPSLSPEEVEAEWAKTHNIDNPLSPWVQTYKVDLNLIEGLFYHDRPNMETMTRAFKTARITAFVAGGFFTLLFVIIWPASMLSVTVLDEYGFGIWTSLSRAWAFAAAAFIIIVPFIQEVWTIRLQCLKNIRESQSQADLTNYHVNQGAIIE